MGAPSLRELGWVVFRDVNRTVGGGTASMELLRRASIGRGWLDATTNALLFAVSRLTPGTNILAYCVGLGWRMQGLAGSLIALAAASVPAALLLGGLTVALGRIDQYRIVQALLGLGMLVAVGLVLSSAWHLWRPYLTRNAVVNAAIIGSATAVLLLFDVTPVRILLVSAAIGALLPRRPQANPEESTAARV